MTLWRYRDLACWAVYVPDGPALSPKPSHGTDARLLDLGFPAPYTDTRCAIARALRKFSMPSEAIALANDRPRRSSGYGLCCRLRCVYVPGNIGPGMSLVEI